MQSRNPREIIENYLSQIPSTLQLFSNVFKHCRNLCQSFFTYAEPCILLCKLQRWSKQAETVLKRKAKNSGKLPPNSQAKYLEESICFRMLFNPCTNLSQSLFTAADPCIPRCKPQRGSNRAETTFKCKIKKPGNYLSQIPLRLQLFPNVAQTLPMTVHYCRAE